MRVGASTRQHARIRKMHREGMSPGFIAKTIQMTDQSLEKILAHLDDRDEVILAVDNDPNVQALRSENAELAARLAKYEDPTDEGTSTTDKGEDDGPEETED